MYDMMGMHGVYVLLDVSGVVNFSAHSAAAPLSTKVCGLVEEAARLRGNDVNRQVLGVQAASELERRVLRNASIGFDRLCDGADEFRTSCGHAVSDARDDVTHCLGSVVPGGCK